LNIVCNVDEFGVERSRKAVHDWVHKADLQPTIDVSSGHATLDETVIRINGQQFSLYATVEPETNDFLYFRLFVTNKMLLTHRLLGELCEKYVVKDTVVLVDHVHQLVS